MSAGVERTEAEHAENLRLLHAYLVLNDAPAFVAALDALEAKLNEQEQELERLADAVQVDPAELERLRGRLAETEQALAFYANEDNYKWGPAGQPARRGRIQSEDRGARARRALGGNK